MFSNWKIWGTTKVLGRFRRSFKIFSKKRGDIKSSIGFFLMIGFEDFFGRSNGEGVQEVFLVGDLEEKVWKELIWDVLASWKGVRGFCG